MVFSSLTFLYLFLPLSLVFHYVSKNDIFRNLSLTIFSLIFYAWAEPMWIFLMIFTAFFDYSMGLFISRNTGKSLAKVGVVLSVIVNLSLLISYKYGGFIFDNLNSLVTLPFSRPTNSLPVGISFYTFMAISYVVDVYRGDVKAQRNPLNFLMFISLFQHLVAGPIVRYKQIANQIEKRTIHWSKMSDGVTRFCIGLFKKVVIANVAGVLVDKYLVTNLYELSAFEGWFGIAMFSIQLYFDFSGYSDMAIGLAKLFGFDFDENFRHPYAATSVADFYRRWHISLGKFFRDYVYIPLGGNRKHHDRNIFIVWFLTGFWHGANWNFALWGTYFGLLMVLEKHLKFILDKTPRILKHSYTLVLIVFSRAIFYFVDFNKLTYFVGNLFVSKNSVSPGFLTDISMHAFWFVLVILLCIPWDEVFDASNPVRIKFTKNYQFVRPAVNVFLLFLATLLLVNATFNPFLYTRF
ncbi:MAG: MBOAT family protein [Flavobacteriia bacterium]|jgi:alginate O-acetyltransferase complex protein AlgI|nr:MBOAT family protein [Flavobacteriia bacterium]